MGAISATRNSRRPRGQAFVRWILLAIFLVAAGPLRAAAKPILAHYMPWYVAKPYSSNWGWHWTMNHFNPDQADANGRRSIASRFYPEIGPYDSADPLVLEYHCLLMKLAGIDGVIVDWYGQDDYVDYGVNNVRTLALLEATRRAGLSFALCYEDATIQREIEGGYITAAEAIVQAQATLRYAETNYFASTNYVRLDRRPLLLNFGPQYFKANAQWVTLFSALQATDPPALFTEDLRLPVGQGAFNWPPMARSVANGGVLSPEALESYLVEFEANAASWPLFISSAFPRFQDIYLEAGLGFTYGVLEDANGATFRATLSRALTNKAALVQLVTWNDFGEGTVVEPTAEFGTRDLVAIQDLRRAHGDPGFPHRADALDLPLRLYHLRREHNAEAILSAELDRISDRIVAGDLGLAAERLVGVEEHQPVIYAPELSRGWLEFSVGGYLVSGGGEIQAAPSLLAPEWATVQSFPAGTNVVVVRLAAPAESGPTFLRVVQTEGP